VGMVGMEEGLQQGVRNRAVLVTSSMLDLRQMNDSGRMTLFRAQKFNAVYFDRVVRRGVTLMRKYACYRIRVLRVEERE